MDRSVRETVRNVLLLLLRRRHLWERVVVGREGVVGALSGHPVAGSVLRICRLWEHWLWVSGMSGIAHMRRVHMRWVRCVVVELWASMMRTRSTLSTVWHRWVGHWRHAVVTGHERLSLRVESIAVIAAWDRVLTLGVLRINIHR